MLFKRITSLLLCAAALLTGPPRAAGDALALPLGTESGTVRRITSGILSVNIGTTSVHRWIKGMPRTANADKLIASAQWRAVQQDITGIFGHGPHVYRLLAAQESLIRVKAKVNNIAHAQSLNAKGNLVEEMMDNFYKSGGWERMDGKRGRNGFDGLYVRRCPNGTIESFLIADAKSGSARLGMTKHGKQLSPEWCSHNFSELLKIEQRKKPQDSARIADLQQLAKLHRTGGGRTPRVFSMNIKQENGKTYYCRCNTDVDGNTIGRPYKVDMSKDSKNKRAICQRLQKHIEQFGVRNADKIGQKIERAFTTGKIASDSDLYGLIKREIPDRKMAALVAHSMGEKLPCSASGDPRGNLQRNEGNGHPAGGWRAIGRHPAGGRRGACQGHAWGAEDGIRAPGSRCPSCVL